MAPIPKADRVLWIDALCIDQTSISEQNVQVQYMISIYTLSRRTVVWLGEAEGPDDPIEYFFDFVKGVKKNQSKHSGYEHWGLHTKPGIYQSVKTKSSPWWKLSNTFSRSGSSGDPLERFRCSLRAFVTHEYWTRIWTSQEYILPANVVLVRSAATLEPANDALSILAERSSHILEPCCWLDFPSEDPETERLIERLNQMSAIKDDSLIVGSKGEASTPKGLDILTAHRIGRDRKAKKFVDHVYGLLGLIDEDIRRAITRDYALPVSTVFQNATEVATVYSGNLAMVELAALHVDYGSWSRDLPSWVIDWASIENNPMFGEPITSSGLFACAQDRPAVFNVLSDSRAVVHGARLSQVKSRAMPLFDAYSDHITNLSDPDNLLQRQKKRAASILERAKLVGVDFDFGDYCAPTEEQKSAQGVFWLTLLMGHTWLPSKKELSSWVYQRMSIDEAYSMFSVWRSWSRKGSPLDLDDWPNDPSFNVTFLLSVITVMMLRGFYLLESGGYACGCDVAGVGDWMAVLYGLDVPCVLGEVEGKSNVNGVNVRHYRFIGTVYMHGLMDGEVVDRIDPGILQDEDFVLV